MTTNSNPLRKLLEAAALLHPKHFRWVSRTLLEAVENDVANQEQKLNTVLGLRGRGIHVRYSDAEVEEMEVTLRQYSDILKFVRELDNTVSDLSTTASVRGWKKALANLQTWMRES